MYDHSWATLCLLQSYGNMPWRRDMRDKTGRAVQLLLKYQHVDGGWRYKTTQVGNSDTLVTVNVRDRQAEYVKVLFCIDTGADACSMTTPFAESNGIVVPRERQGTATGLLGASVPRRVGVLDVQLFGEQFRWPCIFLETTGPVSRLPYGAGAVPPQ